MVNKNKKAWFIKGSRRTIGTKAYYRNELALLRKLEQAKFAFLNQGKQGPLLKALLEMRRLYKDRVSKVSRQKAGRCL